MLRVQTDDQLETVQAAAQQRLDTQTNTFAGYAPEQYALCKDGSAIVIKGQDVMFVISADKDAAVRAFRALQAIRPDAKFVWVGDGPARQQLQRDNPDFVFCGIQRGDDLARHFASGDLFVFPSHSETFGNVTLEALASGVPTVAFDYGAAHEYLRDGVHGAAIACTDAPSRDDAGFIAAVARIGSDDELRGAMRTACRDAVAALRPEQVAEDFDRILQSLANTENRHVASVAT